jgi:hypothetical protein
MGDFDRPGIPESILTNPQQTADRLRFEALDLLREFRTLPATTAERLLDRHTAVTDLRLTSDESPFRALTSANLRERTASLDFACNLGSARFAINGGEHATGLNNYFKLPNWQRWGYQFEAKSSNETLSLQVSSPHARLSPQVNFAYQPNASTSFRAGADFHTHHYNIEAVRDVGTRSRLHFNFQLQPHNVYEAGLQLERRFR